MNTNKFVFVLILCLTTNIAPSKGDLLTKLKILAHSICLYWHADNATNPENNLTGVRQNLMEQTPEPDDEEYLIDVRANENSPTIDQNDETVNTRRLIAVHKVCGEGESVTRGGRCRKVVS